MRVNPDHGRCRVCGGILEIIAADHAGMTVKCAACAINYAVAPDAFDNGCVYHSDFLGQRDAIYAQLTIEAAYTMYRQFCDDLDRDAPPGEYRSTALNFLIFAQEWEIISRDPARLQAWLDLYHGGYDNTKARLRKRLEEIFGPWQLPS